MATREIQPKYEEIFGIEFFYENFPGKFSPNDFGEKGVRKKPIPVKLYKDIISTYFDIYMKELYFMKEPKYFLFGGLLRVCRTLPTVKQIKKGRRLVYNKKDVAMTLFWYYRPSYLFYTCTKLVKTTGLRNKIPKIEKLFRLNFDVELLPKFEKVINDAEKHKKLYVNDIRSSNI